MNKAVMKNSKGFTLVEIAIVMVIFGLILGGIMGPLKMQRDNMQRKETQQSMKTIKHALVGYALINGRIPCPDTSANGLENMSGLNCTNARGTVPWATLGVVKEDAWKHPFTYRVDTQFADNNDGTGCDVSVPSISFEICSSGNISVFDRNGGNLVASGIPAIIVSHGSNGPATSDADEQENSDNNPNFVDKTHINQGYDDFVDWVNINNLVGKMVSAKKLP